MLIKKRSLSDGLVGLLDSVEGVVASTPKMDAGELSHFLGQRDAYLKSYNFIIQTRPKSDEITLEEVSAFCEAESKKVYGYAFSTDIGTNFPHDKKIALGTFLAYKALAAQIMKLKSEKDEEENSD